MEEVLREATATGRVLVVDETRRTGGVGRARRGAAHGHAGRIVRVASKDSFVPLGDASLVLLSEDEIEAAALGPAAGRRRGASSDGARQRKLAAGNAETPMNRKWPTAG